MKTEIHRKTAPFHSKFTLINQLLFIGLILVSNLSFGQDKPALEVQYTPNGIFDKVLDSEGKLYNLSDLQVSNPLDKKAGTIQSKTLLCTPGIFELYFEAGSGMETVGDPQHDQRRAIMCQAFQDISDFLNTPLKNTGNTNKVKFWIRSPTTMGLPSNAAGGASAFYSLPAPYIVIPSQGAHVSGIIDNEIWKTIQSGNDSYADIVFPFVSTGENNGFYHGWASFNFAGTVDWNLDYNSYDASTGYPLNYVDFYSTIIHEVTHALGFSSLINFNGYSKFHYGITSYYGNFFTRYDKFLKSSSDLPLLINTPPNGAEMYPYGFNLALPANTLYPSCTLSPPIFNGNTGAFNCQTSVKYVSNISVPVYNPPCFENGSSLSHFEDACYNGNLNDQYFMMSERASGLFAKRTLTSEERQVLCDIGYSVNTTFGNAADHTFKDYGGTPCPGNQIAGVSDGFSNSSGMYAFQGNSGANITISGILNNDYTAGLPSNLRFEYLEDLYDPDAIFSVTSGMPSTSFTVKSFVPGLHLLRYVPFDIVTGKRGNITYIYLNVFNDCATIGPNQLVKNGSFEEHEYAPTYSSQIYKACGWHNASYLSTADYFNSDATNVSLSTPANQFGNQADNIAGNHGYAGMFANPYVPNSTQSSSGESIKTELTMALQPNTDYKLSFDVSIADNFMDNAMKFQAFITDSILDLTNYGTIPVSNITSDKVFLTNPTFSDSASSANTWETISFTFTTSSNPNLKYLYLGGLNNVEFVSTFGQMYYFVDNVSLTSFLSNGSLDPINNNIDIFPNPAKTVVNISNDENIKHISIFDLQGRILQNLEVNNKKAKLDISTYQAGTYILSITTDSGTSSSKLIKDE